MNMNYTKKQIERMNKTRIADVDVAHECAIMIERIVDVDVAHALAIQHEMSKSRIADVDVAHALANTMRVEKLLTNKERNALKRYTSTAVNKKTSAFTASTKTTAQCFRIETALTDYISMYELINHETLTDATATRIRNHVSYLLTEFRHACRCISEVRDDARKRFKFVRTEEFSMLTAVEQAREVKSIDEL